VFATLRRSLCIAAVGIALLSVTAQRAPASAVSQHSGLRGANSAQDNVTYHANNLRLGWYNAETLLTASNVVAPAFHLIGTLPLRGKSYSQPLYLSNQVVGNGSTHNLLVITDSTDIVYAFDADSLQLVWMRNFTNAKVRQQLSSDTDCDDDWPNDGITGTPVVDRARNALYVVVPTYANGSFFLWLHALSLATGKDATTPVVIHATVGSGNGNRATIDPKLNFNRAGLLEANNTVYVSLTMRCDFAGTSTHGWLLGYNPDTLALAAGPFDTDPQNIGDIGGTDFLGGIWQGGFGIAADASNNIYFTTGNGPYNGLTDFAMSVLQLPPNLSSTGLQFFTPSTWENDSKQDLDLGSGGVMLLPDQTSGPYVHLALAGGKTGMKYLLNRDDLGGLNDPDQALFEGNFAGGQFGGPAYYVDAAGNQNILYGGTPTLNDYVLTTAPYGLTQTSATNVGTLEWRNSGVTPVVSSNGTMAGTAVVWAIQTPYNINPGTVPIYLYAFDGANLGNTLFMAQAGAWTTDGPDTGGPLITPLVANGRVYLASDSMVTVFGLQ
jgi:hypothetical protein